MEYLSTNYDTNRFSPCFVFISLSLFFFFSFVYIQPSVFDKTGTSIVPLHAILPQCLLISCDASLGCAYCCNTVSGFLMYLGEGTQDSAEYIEFRCSVD